MFRAPLVFILIYSFQLEPTRYTAFEYVSKIMLIRLLAELRCGSDFYFGNGQISRCSSEGSGGTRCSNWQRATSYVQ
jgi:FAD synthase